MSILDDRQLLQRVKNELGLSIRRTSATSAYIAEQQWIREVADAMKSLDIRQFSRAHSLPLPGTYRPGDRPKVRDLLLELPQCKLDELYESWATKPDKTFLTIIRRACASSLSWH